MKLVTYLSDNTPTLGMVVNNKIYSLNNHNSSLPKTMKEMLNNWEEKFPIAQKLEVEIKSSNPEGLDYQSTNLISPVNEATSCRDAYAFRQHVATARRNRGVDMIPEFDQYPIFYFTNHNAIQGPGEIECMKDHFKKLDFELEAAIVVGKRGRNITAAEADNYIAGYLIMNDMSARVVQMEEMKLNLGPAKGKDFSTVIGPYMVTRDELEPYKTATKPGHTGDQYDMTMKCWVNGKQVSEGNVNQMDWTFAEILERCAYGTDIIPGDVIGSGTVGTGCFLENNGTGLLNDPNYKPQWLQDGDLVEMEITGLGKLSNTIKATESNHSILALKKNNQSA
jgi:fumarylacetoacetate (FAA) hydrolase